MIQLIKRLVFAFSYKRQVKKALRWHEETGTKIYVIYLNKKVRAVPKSAIKELTAQKRFKKGVTINDIERNALFITK